MNRKLNHDLIGAMPQLDGIRDNLDTIIARFIAWSKVPRPELEAISKIELGLLSETEKDDLAKILQADTELMVGVVDGAVIEAAAGHFYGIDANDYDDTFEVIAAIQGFEDELRVR